MRRSGLLAIPAFAIGATTLQGQSSDNIDAYIRDQMEKRLIPAAAVAVIRSGQREHVSAYGRANVEFGVDATRDTLFSVASVSKAFSAVAVLILVERGQVHLDDPVGAYLTDLAESWRTVTIRQLLNHTSGLPVVDVDAFSTRTIAQTIPEALAVLRSRTLEFQPGTNYSYNGTNYMLLGMLIEKVSGKSFISFCQDNLFTPLSIHAAFGDSRTVIRNRASVYTRFRFDTPQPKTLNSFELLSYEMPEFVYPSAGLNISIADFTTWLIALQTGKLINREHLAELWSPATFLNGKRFEQKGNFWTTYGLGWVLNPRSEHPTVGGTGGLRAAFFIYPQDDLSVVVFTNLQGSRPEDLAEQIALIALRAAPNR